MGVASLHRIRSAFKWVWLVSAIKWLWLVCIEYGVHLSGCG